MKPGEQVGNTNGQDITVKSMVSVIEASDGSVHLRTKGELNIVQLRGMLQMGDYLALQEYEQAMARATQQKVGDIVLATPDMLDQLKGK